MIRPPDNAAQVKLLYFILMICCSSSTATQELEQRYDLSERPAKGITMSRNKPLQHGPIKTFPLRGVKGSPPYVHDGGLLTLEETVEFFNVILGTQLAEQEKADVVAFLRIL